MQVWLNNVCLQYMVKWNRHGVLQHENSYNDMVILSFCCWFGSTTTFERLLHLAGPCQNICCGIILLSNFSKLSYTFSVKRSSGAVWTIFVVTMFVNANPRSLRDGRLRPSLSNRLALSDNTRDNSSSCEASESAWSFSCSYDILEVGETILYSAHRWCTHCALLSRTSRCCRCMVRCKLQI